MWCLLIKPLDTPCYRRSVAPVVPVAPVAPVVAVAPVVGVFSIGIDGNTECLDIIEGGINPN